jgi:hypothetical protein
MPKVRPLGSSEAARGTLAQRLTHRVDKLRQLATKFGARSRRVFLVWLEATGEGAGAGDETVRCRRELLPTPRVTDATAITRRPLSIGHVPDGSVRVDQISAYQYTEDHLRGIKIPEEYQDSSCCCHAEPQEQTGIVLMEPGRVQDPLVFFYEIVEDGRGDAPPARKRYKLGATPWRNETGAQWAVMLEPMSADLDRAGNSVVTAFDVLDVDS